MSDPNVDSSCDFCQIVASPEDRAEVVATHSDWVAFFPLEPATVGHTLVIPRIHVPDLWSTDEALAAELMKGVIRVGKAIEAALTPDGMNLISSSGKAAEQTVFHLHLHLVPRWRGDGFGEIWPPERHTSAGLKAEVAERIRAAYGDGIGKG